MLRLLGIFLFSLIYYSPAQAAYWKLSSTKAEPSSEINQDWLNSITPSGTGAIFHTQLSAKSSHVDRGQSFDSKGSWTIPPEALVPGKKISFQAELTAQKVELGGHWHLGHSLGIYAAQHKAGATATNSGSMQRIVSTATGTSTGTPKNNRASGEWTVPNGSPDSGLTIRVEGSPGGFSVTYSYSWIASGNPPPASTGGNPSADGTAGTASGSAGQSTSNTPGGVTGGSAPGKSSGRTGIPDVSITYDEPSGGARISGQEVEIFRNGNDSGVANGGTAAAFTLSRTAHITSLLAYHYNNGRGAPGGSLQISSNDGSVHGPWKVEVINKVYWVAKPNITLPPGHYRVQDSDPATWSQNAGSTGQGHVIIKGVYAGAATTPAVEARTQTIPPSPKPLPSDPRQAGYLSIAGDWTCDGEICSVQQSGESLTFTRGTSRSSGRFSTPNRVIAENWDGMEGRLGAYYRGNRMAATEAKERFGLEVSEIRWTKGSVWTRNGGPAGGR